MNEYLGKYRGVVKDTADPEMLGRVRCLLPSVLGNEQWLDWAYPMFPIDVFGVPAVETPVYVEFEAGDINRPLYTGWWVGAGDKAARAHPHVYGEEDSSMESEKGGDTVNKPEGGSIDEPEHPFEGQYPKIRSMKFPSGLVIEVDETSEDGPRMQVYHPSGHYWEMYKDGSMIQKYASEWKLVKGASVEHVEGDKAVQVDGTLRAVIDGDAIRDIAGDLNESIGASYYLEMKGSFVIYADGIELNGAGGQMGGVVTDRCICAFTGAPHPDASSSVGASK